MSTEATGVLALASQVSQDAIINWSDEKRKEFTKTFSDRVRVAQFILYSTADMIVKFGIDRQFISEKHKRGLPDLETEKYPLFDGEKGGYYRTKGTIGGRTSEELNQIATERANLILENLPPLKEAVRIISPEVAKMIEQKEAFYEKGVKLFKEADELSGPLDMDDFPATMTLSAFKTEIKGREKRRKKLLDALSEVGKEGTDLGKKINKFLYSGLPGLSDAVIKVIKDHIERAQGFSTLNRRVTEQVQYGDSAAALELLKGFENDEVKISEEVKSQFDAALKSLKLAAAKVSKRPKILKKGK